MREAPPQQGWETGLGKGLGQDTTLKCRAQSPCSSGWHPTSLLWAHLPMQHDPREGNQESQPLVAPHLAGVEGGTVLLTGAP